MEGEKREEVERTEKDFPTLGIFEVKNSQTRFPGTQKHAHCASLRTWSNALAVWSITMTLVRAKGGKRGKRMYVYSRERSVPFVSRMVSMHEWRVRGWERFLQKKYSSVYGVFIPCLELKVERIDEKGEREKTQREMNILGCKVAILSQYSTPRVLVSFYEGFSHLAAHQLQHCPMHRPYIK